MRDAELIRYLVLAAQREGNRRLAQLLKPLGLSPAQAEALRILGDHGPLTLTGLGGMLVCDSGSNPSRLADRLVGAGLVERRPGVEDRRQITLSLTATVRAAEAAVGAIEADFYAVLDGASAGLDLSAVVEFLRRITTGSPAAAALQNRIDAQSRGAQEAK